LLVVLLFGSIGFVEKQYQRRTCTSIEVSIDNQFENYFINEGDIIEIITDTEEKTGLLAHHWMLGPEIHRTAIVRK
jgi:hypothetical protein